MDPRREATYEPDERLGWKKKAGRFVLPPYTPSATAITSTVLADGRRITEPEERAPGRPIVALIGCSITEGWAISDQETFAWKLQQRFPGIEFRNHGIGGYGTYQSLLVLERLLDDAKPPAQRPSMVIYGFIDLHEERNAATWDWEVALHADRLEEGAHPDTPYCTLAADGTLKKHQPDCPWEVLPCSRRLRTMALLEQQLMNLRFRSRQIQKRPITEKLMLEMRDLCRERGVEFVVVMLLMGEGNSRNHYQRFCRAQGINLVDATRMLCREWTVAGEGHPNEVLNGLWANDLARALGPRFRSLTTKQPNPEMPRELFPQGSKATSP
jgi:hypothetical protein